jgi:threonine/homoserine/homoserine lactone efflux protein
MTVEQTLAFVGFAVVMAGTPGPSNTLLTATGARVGVVRGLPALFGVAAGMALMMFLVAFGLAAVLLATPWLLLVVKWTGAAVLLWFAWQIARAGPAHTDSEARPIGFVGAAAFQWINPKSWLACASAAATFVEGAGASRAALLALLFVCAALPSCFVWLAFGAGMQRLFRSERWARAFNLAMAALLVISVVFLVV